MCRAYLITYTCGHSREVYVGCNPPAGVELKANSLCQECCTNPLAYLNINTEKYDMKLLRARAGLEDKCTRAL
jgi:hypothetical protein